MGTLILLLAAILAGECGPIQGDCRLEVARTMANRYMQAGDWGSVTDAYYGRGEPTPADLSLAAMLLSAPATLADERHYYCYSNEDRRTQGWRYGDLVLCDSGYCIHFTHDWPGG